MDGDLSTSAVPLLDARCPPAIIRSFPAPQLLANMKSRWPLLIYSLFVLQAAQGSLFASASLTVSSPSSSGLGAPTISATPSLNRNTSARFTSRYPPFINGSSKATNFSGPVTIFKTIELIPQPVSSDPSVQASDLLQSTGNLVRNDSVSSIDAQKATLPMTSSSAEPRSSSQPGISSSHQVRVPQPADQSVKGPMLRPIIVGGITYAPVHAYESCASQTNSEISRSSQVLVGLLPVIVGGLTYRPVGKEFKVQTPAPASVAGSATEAAQTPTDSFQEGGTLLRSAQPGSLTADSQYSRVSSSFSIQSRSPTSSLASFSLVLGSQTLTALPESSGFDVGSSSSTLRPGFLALTVNNTEYSLIPHGTLTIGDSASVPATSGAGTSDAATTTNNSFAPTLPHPISGQSFSPASPSTFIIEGQTFTAYPRGLAIDGTEVFQGSTAITLSGTAISLGSSDIVIGATTIPFASITGLGSALSSGLSTLTTASGAGFRPSPTSTSATETPHSAAGQLQMARSKLVVSVVMIALTVAAV